MQQVLTLLRRLCGITACAAVVAGAPWLLLHTLGAPGSHVSRLLRIDWRNPDTTDTRLLLLAVLRPVVWLCWLRVATAIVVGSACSLTRRQPPRFARIAPARALLALALGGLLVAATNTTPSPAAPPLAAGPGMTAVSVRATGVQIGWSEAGFLASSVLAVLLLARNRRLRQLPARSRVSTAGPASGELERHLWATAPVDAVDRLTAVWGSAHRAAIQRGVVPAACLLAPSGGVVVLFPSATPEPPAGTATRSSLGWSYPAEWSADGTHDGGEAPPLVQIGRCGADSVHLPLPAAQTLRVLGPESDRRLIENALALGVESATTTSRVERSPDKDLPADEPMTLVERDGLWRLEPLNIGVLPIGITDDDVRSVRKLLESVGTSVTTPRGVVGTGSVEPNPELDDSEVPTPAAEPPPIPTWTFLVRLLGPVDVLCSHGTVVGFERSKSLELLAWMTLHRRAGTREAARAALWEHDVRDSTFANVVSEARRALARHLSPADSDDWVARPRGERVSLHPGVVSDVDLVQAYTARAAHLTRHGADGSLVMGELRSALELVRGAPFIGSGFGWADSEAVTSNLTLLVVATAADLAELALAHGRLDECFWATSIGLSVLPGHEELVALRLRAHAAGEDPVGVRHEWQTYVRSLARDPWQSEPSTWMTDLVRELLGEPVPA